ncbi:MAG TPA: PfkB family carbohydrate kinase [Methylomirabilota bacterium]|nr:PfkB family carbohydrate kinase [Methylomirabilota bacterium]
MAAPDLVAIGHVTLDRFENEVRPGGSALYAAVTAHRLGLSAGILTSHGGDFPLEAVPPQIEVVSVPAPRTTLFAHRVHDGRRALRIEAAARPLSGADVPQDWREAEMVLLAPVIAEVDVDLIAAFPEAAVGADAQGWLRGVGPGGEVVAQPWTPPRALFGRLQALFLSREDVLGHEAQVTEWIQRLPVVVVTAGADGALLYVNGERYEVRPRKSDEIDPTGAGDVFAAAFMVRYRLDGDPWQASEVAACAAGLSVEGEAWSAVPDAAGLERALGAYRAAYS